MNNPIKTLLGRFKVSNISQKSIESEYKLLLENLKGFELANLAAQTHKLVDKAEVKDAAFVELQAILLKTASQHRNKIPDLGGVSNLAEYASVTLHHIEKVIVPALQYEIDARMKGDSYISAMKYDAFNVVRLIELCDFAICYSAMLLHYTLKVHADEASLSNGVEITETSKSFLGRLNHYVIDYANVSTCLLEIDNIKQRLDSIPPTLISSDDISTFSGGGMKNVDPFNMGFISVAWNPFYYIGKWMAEREHTRYKERQERANVIKMRLLYLRSVYNDRPDPGNERRIRILESDLEKLDYDILKYERDLWGDE